MTARSSSSAAFLQRLAIVQVVPEAASEDEEFDAAELVRLARMIRPEDVQLYYQIALGGRRDLALAPEPRIGFEMTLLRMLAFRPEEAATAAPAGAGRSGTSAPRTPVSAAAAAPSVATVDAANWPALVDAAGLSGMVRQFALNCVPASFERDALVLKLDPVAADRRTRQIEDKLVQGLSRHFGREIRVIFETPQDGFDTPARQRLLAEQDKIVAARRRLR